MAGLTAHGLLATFVNVKTVIGPAPQPDSSRVVQDASEVQSLLRNTQTKQVKELIRTNHWAINHPVRQQLWEVLCNQISSSRHEVLYKDVCEELFGEHDLPSSLPPFVDPAYCVRYHLTNDGRKCVEKILQVVHHLKPDVTFCPILYPLISLFLHYVPEDVTFTCIYNLLSEKQTYISQTKASHLVSAYLVMKLTKKFAKSAYLQLEKEIQEHETLENIFQSWLSWIFKALPFPYLVRVIDCYLLDKKKVLYRIVLAILILYTKHAEKPDVEGGVMLKLMDFCQNMPIPVERLFKVAYGIRGFSEKLVNQLLTKGEITVKSQSISRDRSLSAEQLSSADSTLHLKKTSAQIPIVKELRMSESSRTRSVGVIPLGKFKSEIIHAEQMSSIWAWLPLTVTMKQPEVVYSTNRDGASLLAFYMKVGAFEPTVLVVKSTDDEIFGAYCSAKWNSWKCSDEEGKRYIYFGTGETFLFTLVPVTRKYTWVGMGDRDDVTTSAKLFMAADRQMITVGAGNGNGLWLDEQLLHGRTEHCDTFDNEPLSSKTDFECKVVEVIAFT